MSRKKLAEIEAHVVPDHADETFERRLVEAELLLELGDEGRVQPLCAAILEVAALLHAAAEIVAAAGDAVHRPAFAGEARQHLLDRAAGRELDDDEGNGHDAEQRRDHQQQAAQDIGAHQPASPMCLAWVMRGVRVMSGSPNRFRLLRIAPPQHFDRETIVGLRLLEAEHVPVGGLVIRRMITWNPVAARARPGRAH